jgi:hypothetical protein
MRVASADPQIAKENESFDNDQVTLQLKLNYVLRTPKLMDLFKLFCVQTFCDENVDCWVQIEKFSSFDPKEQVELKKLAISIWEEFFLEAAERPVNITQDVRKYLKVQILRVSCACFV